MLRTSVFARNVVNIAGDAPAGGHANTTCGIAPPAAGIRRDLSRKTVTGQPPPRLCAGAAAAAQPAHLCVRPAEEAGAVGATESPRIPGSQGARDPSERGIPGNAGSQRARDPRDPGIPASAGSQRARDPSERGIPASAGSQGARLRRRWPVASPPRTAWPSASLEMSESDLAKGVLLGRSREARHGAVVRLAGEDAEAHDGTRERHLHRDGEVGARAQPRDRNAVAVDVEALQRRRRHDRRRRRLRCRRRRLARDRQHRAELRHAVDAQVQDIIVKDSERRRMVLRNIQGTHKRRGSGAKM
eukprot:gene5621-biopygen23744